MSSTNETTVATPVHEGTGGKNSSAREALPDRLRRWVLGTAWSLKPPRTWGVPATLWMVASHYAGLRDVAEGVPDPDLAL
ncbi:MAG: hypothetical protein V3R81_02440, partial [Gammaproteobacteria bacterium]